MLKQFGWRRSAVAAGCFYSSKLDISCTIHGDDFITEGLPSKLDQLLTSSADVKIMPHVGPEADKSGRCLKRVIRWTGPGLSWQASGRSEAR